MATRHERPNYTRVSALRNICYRVWRNPFSTRGYTILRNDVPEHRIVIPNHSANKSRHFGSPRLYQGNKIITTKYTLLNFIPKNLYEQFHRCANVYFLFLALLNWIPVVEAFRKDLTMIPLVIVLGLVAIKDAIEDYRRYRFDRAINHLLTDVLDRTRRGSCAINEAENLSTRGNQQASQLLSGFPSPPDVSGHHQCVMLD
ncbi:phospholipid-transporting ATPase VD-like isoform X2 [Chiloscyllium plagiosum]|uniref:phospholipid-transporting ATPase VD-like isoform X2 n=1 Tax=Chiloscyllium plagiosum TaxID=36176 RepID=UPI001CB7E527|nr:phospholipid-transporting ATPase VD-like isoform X2 [Chiloscyllium plagiosum]